MIPKRLLALSLFGLCLSVSAQTPAPSSATDLINDPYASSPTPAPAVQHTAMTEAEILAGLKANDAKLESMTAQLNLATFQLRYAVCERGWRRTNPWTKWHTYRFHDPCKQVVRDVLAQIGAAQRH